MMSFHLKVCTDDKVDDTDIAGFYETILSPTIAGYLYFSLITIARYFADRVMLKTFEVIDKRPGGLSLRSATS
jgi:hypothetical protein